MNLFNETDTFPATNQKFKATTIEEPVRLTIIDIHEEIVDAWEMCERDPGCYRPWHELVDLIIRRAIKWAKEVVGKKDDCSYGPDAVIVQEDHVLAVVRHNSECAPDDDRCVEVIRFAGQATIDY
jgi:hypothetical protein